MNIAKKLLFSLLLCGSVFAAACGDDGTAQEGESCSATLKCEDGLGCVAAKEGDETGTCKKTCTATSCSDKQECKETAKVKDAESAPSVCQDKGGTQEDTQVQVGETCTQTNKCIDTAVCVLAKATDSEGTCQVKCAAETPAASDCTENGKPACVETDGFVDGNPGKVLTCVATDKYYGGNAVPVGKKCTESVTCGGGGVCVTSAQGETVGTCTAPCIDDAACSGETPLCRQAPSQLPASGSGKICSPKLGQGVACSKNDECKDGYKCVDSACAKECTDNNGCTDTGADTTCSAVGAKQDATGASVQICTH